MKLKIKYLASACYDLVVVMTLLYLYTAVLLVFTQGKSIPPDTLWYQISLLSWSWLYYQYSLQKSGQTIGMKAWNLQLVAEKGAKLSFINILLRFLLAIPSLLLSFGKSKNASKRLSNWTQTRIISLHPTHHNQDDREAEGT